MSTVFSVRLHLFCLLLGILIGGNAQAEELLRTGQTWEGGAINYPQGEPEITSVKLTIAENETTPFHCHPVPTLGYILSGTVAVETTSGEMAEFSAGQSVVEVLGSLHRGKAVGGPVEIVVFYVGATGIPNTILGSDDPEHRSCKQ